MITVFNRKELARLRTILEEKNIDYQIKTVNRMSPSPVAAGARSRMGSFGQEQSGMCEYIIYVRKEDYEEAMHLIR